VGESDSLGDRVPDAGLTAHDSTTDEARLEADPRRFRLQRGEAVHRYVVLYELGAGGMGVVYAAYDPELDRKVALKLLHPDASSRGRTRLLREAKAIASLTHPNIVTVHDVGTYEGRVFVAMEFIDGVTFRQWRLSEQRPWRQVVEVLRAAGMGLAAAHAADLVHRDFKPDNIMVDRGGRVVVLDFGLARRANTHDDDGVRDEDGSRPDPSRVTSGQELDIEITKAGALLGTPAYMAPEQHLSKPTDARTDQFAFCVVMWEALHGMRPFRGHNAVTTAAHVLRGEIEEPPRKTDVPNWVRKVLVRGLSLAPKDRHPDMRALLEALSRDRFVARRRGWVAGTLLLAGAGAAIAVSYGREKPCAGAEERLAGVWNAGRRDEIHRAFVQTEIPYAATAWTGVESKLDEYLRAWVESYRDACEDTHVRQTQSVDMLDLRMACLRSRRSEVQALVDELARADELVVRNAVEAVSGLGRLDRCEDLEALAARAPLPEDPQVRRRIEEQRDALSDAKAKEVAGRYDAAFEVAEQVASVARSLEHAPLIAEAELRLGSVLERKGEFEQAEGRLLEAIWKADASHHDELAAEAWVRLVWVTGVERMRPEQGHLWASFAQSALARLGRAELLEATLTHNLGGVLYRERRLDEALEHYRAALLAQKKLLGTDDPAVGTTLNHIGNTLIELGRFEMARDYCERSLELRRRTLGERHPKVAASLNNLGELTRKEGKPAESLEHARASLTIVGRTGGPEEIVALRLEQIALTQLEQWEELETPVRRLLELETQARGPRDAQVLRLLLELAETDLRLRRPEAALERYALVHSTATEVENREAIARGLHGLARAHASAGRLAEAKRFRHEAREAAGRIEPPVPALLEAIESLEIGR
jgi:eukaryotic-like serine/threonine-protein kinase